MNLTGKKEISRGLRMFFILIIQLAAIVKSFRASGVNLSDEFSIASIKTGDPDESPVPNTHFLIIKFHTNSVGLGKNRAVA